MNPMALVLILYLIYFSGMAQITAIPDPNFEQALIDLGIDTDGMVNGQVFTSDIEGVVSLDVEGKMIHDLIGIEDFSALETLDCSANFLNTLNVSQNSQLRTLFCGINGFTEPLDLSQNMELTVLDCRLANLTSLDVSHNVLLEELYCNNDYDVLPINYFTELDLSNNPSLTILSAFDLWDLEALDLGQNPDLQFLDVSMMPASSSLQYLNLKSGNNGILTNVHTGGNIGLTCIQVDDEEAANNGDFPYSEWNVGANVIYSKNCSLGLGDLSLREQTLLCPNPVKNTLTIKNAFPIEQVFFYNVPGMLLVSVKEDFDAIDITSLPNGIYLVEVLTTKGISIKKFIKE